MVPVSYTHLDGEPLLADQINRAGVGHIREGDDVADALVRRGVARRGVRILDGALAGLEVENGICRNRDFVCRPA